MERHSIISGKYVTALWWGFILTGLYLTSLYNYLLFHGTAEVFSIVVACGIFMVAWNSREFLENNYLLFVGIAYLFVAAVDFVHTLAYQGMGVFPGFSTDLPTQLWIAARYLQSTSLLIAPFFLDRRLKISITFIGYAVVVGFLLASILHWDIFPACFIEGLGLTIFKKTSEYIIIFILLAAIVILIRRRRAFDRVVLKLLVASLAVTMASELAFTFYVHVYGFSNLIGHMLKIVSFYLIYRAIIHTGLVRPYALLFRNLKRSEEDLRKARDELEHRVEERTGELAVANERLREQIIERMQAQKALKASEIQKQAILDASIDRIRLVDRDMRIIWANRTSTKEINGSPEDIVGSFCYELFVRRDTPCIGCPAIKALTSGEVEHSVMHQTLSVGIEGETYWDNYAIPIKDESGEIVYVIEIARNITDRVRSEEALKMSEAELRRLSSRLLSAQEEERRRIALELHDSIAQSLAAIKFGLESKLQQMGKQPAPPGISLESIIATVQNGIEETRRIMTSLRPSVLDDLGIVATISWHCREFEEIYAGVRIEREISVEEIEVPDGLKIVIYRIIQEALHNIAKHSRAKRVIIALAKGRGMVTLTISDNGAGFDVEQALAREGTLKGLGLGSMKERAELSGGSFFIESLIGQGTTIKALWPCNPGEGGL
jgi:PAS domain S-box-containing protein